MKANSKILKHAVWLREQAHHSNKYQNPHFNSSSQSAGHLTDFMSGLAAVTPALQKVTEVTEWLETLLNASVFQFILGQWYSDLRLCDFELKHVQHPYSCMMMGFIFGCTAGASPINAKVRDWLSRWPSDWSTEWWSYTIIRLSWVSPLPVSIVSILKPFIHGPTIYRFWSCLVWS